MTQAEKADRYDEVVNKLKRFIAQGVNPLITRADIQDFFPELTESEDEKNIKDLIDELKCSLRAANCQNDACKGGHEKRIALLEWGIAWLEKQDEQKETLCDKCKKTQPSHSCQDITVLGRCYIDDIDTSNKIKQKFHEGDWVVYKNEVCQIVKRKEGCNKLVTVFGIEKELVNERNLSTARLWDIADAKDGDVLISHSNQPFIYNGNFDSLHVGAHCAITINSVFVILNTPCDWTGHKNLHPATKEQRDALFTKMKEAGYEWDDRKKKLRKIEQKPADKIKSQFHEDDWITNGQLTCKILRVIGKSYELHLYNDDYCHFETDIQSINKDYHLWSIRDAKDGDILVSKHNQPFIYNGIFDEESVGAYCGIDKFGNDFLKGIFSCDWSYKEGVKPATKKQRDILFSKMKDAGYEFDFEKKELKKFHVIDEGKAEMDYCFTKMMNGEKVSSAWSEDDEKMVNDIIAAIDTLYYHGMVNWLKSLKDRVQPQNMWKPSKEQIIALRWVLNNIPYNKHKEEISGLLDQIKDLFMEEHY